MQFPRTSLNSRPRTLAENWMLATVITVVTAYTARLSAHVPGTDVPIVMTVYAVLLSGLLLGPKWGAISQLQYLAIGAAGAPVFALGNGGLHELFGNTGGYLWSYPLVAALIGWISTRTNQSAPDAAHEIKVMSFACAIGLALLYTVGTIWHAVWHAKMMPQNPMLSLFQGFLIFLAWDMVKAAAAIATARGLRSRI